ncbi:hypothetical protein FPD38_01725 [Campylobacter volucris]|uniref:indole-3-glycerol-phosphate synthase n=1 Tax=Campylobacter volucris TaxID=1031542 RepID=A0A5C7DTS7_9BACT|nr:hypothetical protein [Campylobacter volucris]TXE89443.1 hypothetical protein FPD38_01725 [Campylobacter volucris]
MFEKINLEQNFKQSQKKLEQKKEKIPYDVLGRSLASNAFYPKDLYLMLLKNQVSNILFLNDLNFKKDDFDGVIINTFLEDVQNLSLFRRYSQKPIIQFDFIFDEYQILESLVYGADAFYIQPKMLTTLQLKKLYSFAIHLGLEAIFFTQDKSDINHSILAGARIFHIEDEELLKFLPKNKAIISKNIKHLHACIKD